MFVAISRFVVRNGMQEQVRRAFIDRPHLVDGAPGFVRMEVLRPQGTPEEFLLMTWWTDERSFETWHRGHTFKDSHADIPRGLKLVPGEQRVTRYEQVAD